MNTTPLISIVMSAYNNERDVAKAINSVLAQTYSNWELLVSDDASLDSTKEIIDSYQDPRIRKYHATFNKGIVSQMNSLFSKTSGDFITILDADDMLANNKLELQLQEFIKNPKLALCLGSVAICDENDKVSKITNHYPKNDQDIRLFINEKNAFPCGNIACMMFRKSSLQKHGGYQDTYQGIGSWDVDLSLRILGDGDVIAVPQVLYYWRKHAFSFSRKLNFNPLRNQSHRLAHLLYQQRLKHGRDDLTGLNNGELEKLKSSIHQEYQDDPSRILREICNSKDLPKSVRLDFGIRAIKTRPGNLTNYRYLIKALFK